MGGVKDRYLKLERGGKRIWLALIWSSSSAFVASCLLSPSFIKNGMRGLFHSLTLSTIDGVVVFSSLIASPLIETVPLLLVKWVSLLRTRIGSGLTVIAYSIFAFVLHGASLGALGRSASFAILAVFFLHSNLRTRYPYLLTSLSHAMWNAASIVLIISVRLFASRSGADLPIGR